jgi:streptomycin 6-kinase
MASGRRLEVPSLLRHRAIQLGEQGEQWLANLGGLLGEIEEKWALRLQSQMSGGTEALVFAVSYMEQPAVVKLGLPGSLNKEAYSLALAEGRGYAKLLAYDEARDMLLLERLGERLSDSGLPVNEQIGQICATLKVAWRTLDGPNMLTTGADKARSQAQYIRSQWDLLGQPCAKSIVDLALDYAHQRERAYSQETSVLVHGDAHMWNTLQLPTDVTQHRFVDPDGLFAERALDLAISLREWRKELLRGDTLKNGRDRCALLSDLTGVDGNAIWQWGFIEHVSCGLLDKQLGDENAARQHFAIAEHWAIL